MYFNVSRPIAVIDSGIGGISVLKQLINKYGGGNYIYFADNLNMPYGNKTKDFVSKRVNDIINFLNKKYNSEKIIIACNTASTAINSNNYTNVYTMKFDMSKIYYATNLTHKNLNNLTVISDSNLPTLIEKNIFNRHKLNLIIKKHVIKNELNKQKEIVLGCTHYELVKDLFEKNCKNTKFYNNSEFILNDIKHKNFDELNIILIMSKYSKDYYNNFLKIINQR